MSILDALRVQKANQQSVSQLAALPQNEIIRLAQMGHIPADVVPVVISEKARMAKEMANLQAAAQTQGRPTPTVIEQAMQANAQAESGMPPQAQPQAPQMPQQAPPQAPGVAGLPTGQMFQGQNFESGGIVAFSGKDESFVEGPTGLKMLRSEMAPQPGAGPSSLADFIAQYRGLTEASRKESPEEIAYREALQRGMTSPQERDQQKYMRLLEAGLGIMGGESPYGLTNIGRGAQSALKGYGEDVRAAQAQKLAELRTAAETARAKRTEGIQDIQGGSQLYSQYLDRELRREISKESQLGAKYADNYLAMKRAGGDQRPEEVIKNEGFNEFFKRYGYAAARVESQAETARGAQALGYANIGQRFITEATRGVDNALAKPGSTESKEFRRLRKEDPNLTLDDYRTALIRQKAQEASDLEKELRPAPGAAQPPGASRSVPQGGQATAPSAAPPASPQQYRIGETYVVQSGPHKGKVVEWDGTGFKLKD